MRRYFQTLRTPVVIALSLLFSIEIDAQFWDIPLPKPGIVEGIVVDAETGLPLANVTVIAPWPQQWPAPPPDGPMLFPVVLTDAAGKFVRDNIYGLDDRAGAIFNKDGYYVSQSGVWAMRPGEHIRGVTVLMKRRKAGIVSGRILDSMGNAAANVSVTLYRDGRALSIPFISQTRTDDRGEFRISDVSAGRYRIGFSVPRSFPPGGRPSGFPPELMAALPMLYPAASDLSNAEVITVEDQKEIRLRDTLVGNSRLGKIRLHIVNAGEAAKSLTLSGHLEYEHLTIEKNGELSLDIRPDGPQSSEIWLSWNDTPEQSRDIKLKSEFDGRDQELWVHLAETHGRLSVHAILEGEDSATAAAKEIAVMTLEQVDSPYSIINLRPSSVSTVEADGLTNGLYKLTRFDVSSKVYLASARQGDRDVLSDGIEISERAPTVEIRLRSNPGILQGRVLDAKGNPVEGAYVIVSSTSMNSEQLGSRRGDVTDNLGNFRVNGLTPGKYLAYAATNIAVDFISNNSNDKLNHNTVVHFDPTFAETFRTRAVPVAVEEGHTVTQNLSLIEH